MVNETTGVGRARLARLGWFCLVAVIGCLVDLGTKSMVFGWLGQPEIGREKIYWVVQDYVGIETALNHGALFGLGQGMVPFFCVMSFLALVGIAFWLWKKRGLDDALLTFTLALMTGGILGNLYDRLGLWSHFQVRAVRDWIRFSYDYDAYVWPNFNIADSLLVCGAILLIWHSYRAEQAAAAAPPTQAQP